MDYRGFRYAVKQVKVGNDPRLEEIVRNEVRLLNTVDYVSVALSLPRRVIC